MLAYLNRHFWCFGLHVGWSGSL